MTGDHEPNSCANFQFQRNASIYLFLNALLEAPRSLNSIFHQPRRKQKSRVFLPVNPGYSSRIRIALPIVFAVGSISLKVEMKVIVSSASGFCWGVRRAMDAALEASARYGHKESVQTLGPLIHNPQATGLLALRGVRTALTLQDVRDGTVVIRAHGIPREELRALNERRRQGRIRIFNATCPEVGRVQSIIRKYSAQGYFVVIAGNVNHAEVVAHRSFADHGCAVVADALEAQDLPGSLPDEILLVAQTTFRTTEFRRIVDCMHDRGMSPRVRNTICRDTCTRQAEARELIAGVDRVVVVGGRQSNNTLHLVEVARAMAKPVQHVETASELDLAWIQGHEKVGVLAGASTPNWIVGEVVDKVEKANGKNSLLKWLGHSIRVLQAPEAIGLVLLSLTLHALLRLPIIWTEILSPSVFLLGLCTLSPYLDPLGMTAKGQTREIFLSRNRGLMISIGVAALIASGTTAWMSRFPCFALALSIFLIFLVFPMRFTFRGSMWSLRRIRGSKDLGQALAPAFLVLGWPMAGSAHLAPYKKVLAFGLLSSWSLAAHATRHVGQFHNDRILGPESLPAAYGIAMTRTFIWSSRVLGAICALVLLLGCLYEF